jgi:hypothetical protein
MIKDDFPLSDGPQRAIFSWSDVQAQVRQNIAELGLQGKSAVYRR